jgi:hypothetical protein
MKFFVEAIIRSDYLIAYKVIPGEKRIRWPEVPANHTKLAVKNLDHLLMRRIADAGPNQQETFGTDVVEVKDRRIVFKPATL